MARGDVLLITSNQWDTILLGMKEKRTDHKGELPRGWNWVDVVKYKNISWEWGPKVQLEETQYFFLPYVRYLDE
ncbi:hypothetical protein P7K49_005614 [Saguinus oedipus]|uniref:Uncharacterized protein n=1 Tax=Saguinus oedipus TaxID=9490 RepID=A0ABQ9W021_SAGOE|nr:hypothetical protein P7K49_005614 [Saguinus oedipus]